MAEPTNAPSNAALEAHLNAATAMLGLTVAPDWRASVLGHLKATLAAAALVDSFPLDEDVEPAPVYRL